MGEVKGRDDDDVAKSNQNQTKTKPLHVISTSFPTKHFLF